ncbi:MAG: hypothetical protein GY725_19910 [bacterium]|nr:hypothetical protein [bacterium]
MGSRTLQIVGIVFVVLIAFVVRAAGLEFVLVGDEVIMAYGDGMYHARRALFSFVNFPAVLWYDSYINYPDGAPVMVPPLLDWIVAGVARLFGTSQTVFERTLVWMAPLYGTLAVIPVYAIARRVRSHATGLLAGLLYALMPIMFQVSRVGNGDHHSAVSLLGAALLATCMVLLAPRESSNTRPWVVFTLVFLRLALLLSWNGSLLYLGLLEATWLLCGALGGRRSVLAEGWISAGITSIALMPIVLALPVPIGGRLSAGALSFLHVLALFGAAIGGAGFWRLEVSRLPINATQRVVRILAFGITGAVIGLAVPAVRQGLGFVLEMFSSSVQHSGLPTLELMPLFSLPGRIATRPPEYYYGGFAYLIPLAPFAALIAARNPEHRLPAIALAAWAGVLGMLAIWQIRYGWDFAAAGSACFALGLIQFRGVAEGAGIPKKGAVLFVALLAIWLLRAPLYQAYLPLKQSVDSYRGQGFRGDVVLGSRSGSIMRFLKTVREHTPETAGYLDPEQQPEYGVLSDWGLGHALHYYARRASAADGFGNLLARERFSDAVEFFQRRRESEALASAERLGLRFVIASSHRGADPQSIGVRLYGEDGSRTHSNRALTHFRLIVEGPKNGRGLVDPTGSGSAQAPFKLFEIVEGALIEVRAAARTRIVASLDLEHEGGRRFTYRVRNMARDDGWARVRVPYSTSSEGPLQSDGLYRVQVGSTVFEVAVSDEAVRTGARIRPAQEKSR